MEIYPARQLQMLLCALLCGGGVGVFYELLVAVRILLGVYEVPAFMQARYARPLPLLHRPLPLPNGKGRRVLRGIVIALQDLLLCLLLSVGVILILYAYNDGAMRLAVPVLALIGLTLWRLLPAVLIAPVTAYLAYLLAAFFAYLRAILHLPIHLAHRLATRVLLPFFCRTWRRLHRCWLARRSAALCSAQLAAATHGFSEEQKKGSVTYGKRKKKKRRGAAMDHHGACDPGVLRRAGHHRREIDGMESAPKGKGSA